MESKLVKLINDLKSTAENITTDFKNIDLIIALEELKEIDGYDELKNELTLDVNDIIKYNTLNMTNLSKNVIIKYKSDNNLELVSVIGRIFNILFYNNYHNIKIINRNDLIALYVGHTTSKVNNLLNKNLNQIIIIEEFDNLLHKDDLFGKEALVALNSFISRNPNKISFIFAGNKNILENENFNILPGLRSKCWFQYEL